MTNIGRNWKNQFRGDFKIVDPEPTHSYHGGGFAQDFVDADGRLIHATWRGEHQCTEGLRQYRDRP